MTNIRLETTEDIGAIHALHRLVFGRAAEAQIVDTLRLSCPDFLSLVAVQDKQIIGHILFSTAILASGDQRIQGMGLAPLAVLPDYQRRGAGSQLVQAGLARLEKNNCPFIIVLGHSDFYSRFQFEPASKYQIRCQWEDVPDNAFMIKILQHEALKGNQGIASYRKEFDLAV